jgi:alpha-L-fucosidase
MAEEWLVEDLWRAHVSWLTPEWIGHTEEGRKAFSAKQWIETMQAAHYRTLIFYTKHHDGFCTFPSKHARVAPERDYFGECVKEAHARSMKIMAYYSSVLDVMIAADHEDWRVRQRDGTPPSDAWYSKIYPGAYLCINNPGYRAVVLDQLRELLAYKPDGIWLDVYSPLTLENCFCAHCQARYAKEQKGLDLFDTRGTGWYRDCYADFLKDMNALIKGTDPHCVVTCNTGPRDPNSDAIQDFLTHEGNSAEQDSAISRAVRDTKKPHEVTYRMYTIVGSWAMKSRDTILLESATIVAHNGACSIEFAPTNTARFQHDAVATLSEVGAYIRQREKYLLRTTPLYDACYLLPDSSYGKAEFTKTLQSWDSVMQERDIPYSFGFSRTDLSPFPLVICDSRTPMTDGLAARLADYVHKGGSLIVECNVGEGGSKARQRMSEVLGIEITGHSEKGVHYLSRIDSRLMEGMGQDELIVEGPAVTFTPTTAEPLARYTYEVGEKGVGKYIWMIVPPAARGTDDVGISENTYGAGKALFLGCPLGFSEIPRHKGLEKFDRRVFCLQFAANLARFLIGDPLIREATPAGIEVVVNAQKGRHVVHLLNRYIEGEYYESRNGILHLADVVLPINEKRIGRITRAFFVTGSGEERETALKRSGTWAEITIPRLGVHEMIVLEH